jgi:hypothetical protein
MSGVIQSSFETVVLSDKRFIHSSENSVFYRLSKTLQDLPKRPKGPALCQTRATPGFSSKRKAIRSLQANGTRFVTWLP